MIHEIEDIEKGGPIAIADYYVDNSKDVDTFHQEFGKVLDEIGFWD